MSEYIFTEKQMSKFIQEIKERVQIDIAQQLRDILNPPETSLGKIYDTEEIIERLKELADKLEEGNEE